MKVFINREVINGPYGGGNAFIKAFMEIAPKLDVTVGTRLNQKYDAVLLMDPRPDETTGIGIDDVIRYKLFQPKVKIFQRVNECDARKQTTGIDAMLANAGQHNDFTFFVSDWMRDYHQKRNWPCANTEVIYNGVDRSVFFPTSRGLLVTDAHVTRIVTHHWSDNPYKGEDVHKWLDQFVAANSEFHYTYIGRTGAPLPNSEVVAPLFGAPLGEKLRQNDIYVTATVCDPGPNHVIEAIASGLPTYAHVRGGGAVEFVGQDHTFETVEQLTEILKKPTHEPNKWQPPIWEECISAFVKRMKEVVG